MTRFKDSDPSVRTRPSLTRKERLRNTGLIGGAAASFLIVLTANYLNNGSDSPDAESCSPKTSINPDNMRSSSNGDHVDAATYQINNAITAIDAPQGIEYSYRNIDQQAREKLATFVVPMIERNDDPATVEIETGEVCVTLDDGEFSASAK